MESYLRPWVEEQLEALMSIIAKYVGKLNSSQHGKEYSSVLRSALNEVDRQGISISHRVEEFVANYDMFAMARDDESNMLKVISELD